MPDDSNRIPEPPVRAERLRQWLRNFWPSSSHVNGKELLRMVVGVGLTLLLTGLTRDGVYRVEGGEITGAVNNFRFNESPIALLDRFTAASATVPSFSREWGDYFPRTATPALLVPDFNMSSVSQAQ